MACSTKCNVCLEDQNIEEESVCYCVECNEFFCQSHLGEHKSVRFTKSHKTVTVSDGIKLQEKQTINRSKLGKGSSQHVSEKMHLQFNFYQYGEELNRKAPGKPEIVNVGSDSLTIEWEEPDDSTQTYTYQLSYKMTDVPNSKWKIHSTDINQNTMKLTNLKSDTSFCFRVRAVFDDEEGPYSPSSDIVKTVESPAVRLKEFSSIVQEGTPERRALPITQVENSRNDDAMTQKFELVVKFDAGITTEGHIWIPITHMLSDPVHQRSRKILEATKRCAKFHPIINVSYKWEIKAEEQSNIATEMFK